jgi:hypothetical protein
MGNFFKVLLSVIVLLGATAEILSWAKVDRSFVFDNVANAVSVLNSWLNVPKIRSESGNDQPNRPDDSTPNQECLRFEYRTTDLKCHEIDDRVQRNLCRLTLPRREIVCVEARPKSG